MSIKCNNTECKHHFEGGCWLEEQFEYDMKELYGWDTPAVDDVVRLYEDTMDVILSDDYEGPTKSRPFWTYGLEDGGYLQVIPITDSSVRLEQYLDDQLVRSVVYRTFEGFREVE